MIELLLLACMLGCGFVAGCLWEGCRKGGTQDLIAALVEAQGQAEFYAQAAQGWRDETIRQSMARHPAGKGRDLWAG